VSSRILPIGHWPPSSSKGAELWLRDERMMALSLAAKGLLIDLLVHAAEHGSVPDDVRIIARIARADLAVVRAAWREIERARFFERRHAMFGRLVLREVPA
jgi:hypothetical protein